MGLYRISDLNIEINTECKTLLQNAEKFKVESQEKPNIILSISQDLILQLMEEYEGRTAEQVQTDYFAYAYSRELFDFNGIPFRGIAVKNNDKCVLFSAPFEEVNLLDYLPQSNIVSVNFPGIRLIGKDFFVYGTPFGSFGDLSKDIKLELSSIVFVDKERFSSLKKLEPKDFVKPFTRSVTLNIISERTKHTLYMLEKLTKRISIYGVESLDDIDYILKNL